MRLTIFLRALFILIFAAPLLGLPGTARAACVDPVADAPQIYFDRTEAVLAYCNDSDWIAFPKGVSGPNPCGGTSSWAPRAAGTGQFWAAAYGDGRFVAVSQDNAAKILATSEDGLNWTMRTQMDGQWRAVTYGGNQFVAVAHFSGGANYVATSPDGIVWTLRSVPAATAGLSWSSVAYGAGTYVALAFNGATGTNVVITSPDGINWTERTGVNGTWYSVTHANGLFVAVGRAQVMTSPDGISWTARAIPLGWANWTSVSYGGGTFVAVADANASDPPVQRVMTSPDGITWTRRAATEANGWSAVTYGNGMFVAVANSGANRVMTSPDGATWTAMSAPEANGWRALTYGEGLFVAMSNDGTNRAMTAECVRSGCTNPSREAGVIIFNQDHRVMQWCDGAAWHPLGPIDPPGPNAGCSNPARATGHLLYNTDYRVFQYCDGNAWRMIGQFPCTSCGGSANEKVVFFTKDGLGGRSLGGVAGADARCQAAAEAAGLRGTYLAWIADSTISSAPVIRFNQSSVPYVRIDSLIIADDWNDLTDGSLDNAIRNETNIGISGNGVWTNVLPDGTRASSIAADHCDNWTVTGITGAIGNRSSTNTNWTNWQTGYNCTAAARLFCFEQ